MMIIKRMIQVDPHPENLRPAYQFGHIRLGFDCSGIQGGLLLNCVSLTALKM